MQNLPFEVDYFLPRAGRRKPPLAHFLTHAHADHLQGIKAFTGRVFCSSQTAHIVSTRITIPPATFFPLPSRERVKVSLGNGWMYATLIPTTHCYGSCMFLFEGEFGRVLHSGDIRATPEMASTVKEINEVDIAFVDATYCHPDFDFPTQEDAMFECTRLALQARVDDANTDIYVGVDSLGKEELLIAISKALRQPANVRKDRYDIIAAHDDSNLHHFQLQAKEEQSTVSRQQGSLVADSWWLLSPSRTRKQSGPGRNILILQATCSGREKRHESVPGVTVRRVQYSSHSSFSELQSFVHALGAERVFATPESVYDDGKIREPSLWFGNPRMTIKKRVRANGPCIERVGWALDKLRQPANGAVFQDCNNVIVISDDEDEPSVRAGEKSQFQSCDGVVASSDGERDGCGDIAATVGRKWSGSVICEELYSIPLVNKYGEAIPQPP